MLVTYKRLMEKYLGSVFQIWNHYGFGSGGRLMLRLTGKVFIFHSQAHQMFV